MLNGSPWEPLMIFSNSWGVMHSYYGREVGMEKAELHVHLEGSIEAETLMTIDPSVSRAEIEAHLHGRTFEEFWRGYIWVVNRLRTPEHYAIATRALLDKLANQDVTYVEITLSAGVVLWKGQDLAAVYDAV